MSSAIDSLGNSDYDHDPDGVQAERDREADATWICDWCGAQYPMIEGRICADDNTCSTSEGRIK